MKKIIVLEDGRKKVVTLNDKPSKTDQQWKDDCDVNYILRKYRKTGVITHVARQAGHFSDVSDIPDLLQGYERVKSAKDAFMELPAMLRNKFDNSMEKMVTWLQDPANEAEAIDLGLRPKKQPDMSIPKPVEPPAAKIAEEVKKDG